MNACAFCKHAKRKCSKTRPSCSNCIRLRKFCLYTEDTAQPRFSAEHAKRRRSFEWHHIQLAKSLTSIGLFGDDNFHQSLVDIAKSTIGSLDMMTAIAAEFFTGTHQRIPALSRIRFNENVQSLTESPRPDFALLCLSILLIQQLPSGRATKLQSPLYVTVKNFINLLESSTQVSIDLLHSRILAVFYEMGHGLHTAAYVSVSATARTARALGLHRKRHRVKDAFNLLVVEEEKRAWWAIATMDRFINLCNGDALLVTEDAARSDPLPMEDIMWSEGSTLEDVEAAIATAPYLDAPFDTTVGQMARECQVAHLVGHVIRHVFDPLNDSSLNEEEGFQLERTLRAYIPLLINEELRIGKYCGAYGACNSALFILYEFMLSRNAGDMVESERIYQAIDETSLRALTFAEATHKDRYENYPIDTQSPYLIYSLYQAAIVQYRSWKQTGDSIIKHRFDTLRDILNAFTARWMIAWQYLDSLENLTDEWPPLATGFQGLFISTGKSTITT